MLFDSKGTVFHLFAWKKYAFYGLFEDLFGCRENDIFYVYFEVLLRFREKRVFGEKPSFAKVPCFMWFSLLTSFGELIFLVCAELSTKVSKNHLPKWARN